MEYPHIYLKPGREKSIRAFHPWIFSGAIDRLDDQIKSGNLVSVYSGKEEYLGTGYFNSDSQITVRILSFEKEKIDFDFFVRKLTHAKKIRAEWIPPKTNAFRWVNSEGDFLPGLIVDSYGDYLVIQISTRGMLALKPLILKSLESIFRPKAVCDRTDPELLKMEGVKEIPQEGLSEEKIPDVIEIEEYGHRFLVDIKNGQKTGFFLDQRENRKLIEQHAKGKRVLNCFSYTGGFSVYAAKGGAAEIVSVDIQKKVIQMAGENLQLNGVSAPLSSLITENVFDFLRSGSEEYDLIILDPPAFCRHKSEIMKASRGYKDINLYALKRLRKNGLLFTSSCSTFIDSDLFQKIVFAAAKDAQRGIQILHKSSHAPDHPVSIYHPEGAYLKGLLLQS